MKIRQNKNYSQSVNDVGFPCAGDKFETCESSTRDLGVSKTSAARAYLWGVTFTLVLLGILFAGPANALIIISEAKTGVVSPNLNTTDIGNTNLDGTPGEQVVIAASNSDSLVEISRSNEWQINNPLGRGATWVSNGETGQDQSIFQHQVFSESSTDDERAASDWIFKVTEEFYIGGDGHIDFTIWADDTARVFFDGALLQSPVFTQDICAAGTIGCQPSEYFNFKKDIQLGKHTIEIYTYQLGYGENTNTNPFGVLYSGEVTDNIISGPPSQVPEPAMLILTGMSLLGFGAVRLRKARKLV